MKLKDLQKYVGWRDSITDAERAVVQQTTASYDWQIAATNVQPPDFEFVSPIYYTSSPRADVLRMQMTEAMKDWYQERERLFLYGDTTKARWAPVLNKNTIVI